MRRYIFALSAFLTPVLLSAPAYASEFGGEGEQHGASRLDVQLLPVTRALGDLVDVMEQVFSIMVSNPLLAVILAGSLFALGVRIFKKVKSAAKG